MDAGPTAGLVTLFAAAFASATLLPGGSEIALAAFLVSAPEAFWPAIAVATAGNTLGGLTSYAIGRVLPQPRTEVRALALARRYGVAALLLSWLPVVGDALCVASGWLRHNVLAATAAIAAGKFARYVVLGTAVRAMTG